MRCPEFAQVVAELARDQIMDAAQRAQGLAHAAGCTRCAARLADERTLTAGLRALATRDAEMSASAGTETALLAAFRQRAASPNSAPQFTRAKAWPRWAWAAAAAILLALGLVVLRALQEGAPARAVIVETPLPRPVATLPAAQHTTPPERQITQDQRPAPRLERVAQRISPRRVSNQSNRPAPPLLIRDSITLYANDSEVTSDFYSLTYSANAPPLESGHLIRVQMPRSALVSYGLPVSPERADVPVKADLLVGEDGLARAIRFVR